MKLKLKKCNCDDCGGPGYPTRAWIKSLWKKDLEKQLEDLKNVDFNKGDVVYFDFAGGEREGFWGYIDDNGRMVSNAPKDGDGMQNTRGD